MIQKKFLKSFIVVGSLSATLAPIAIAASCGSSSDPAPTFASQIKVDTTSLSDDVKWMKVASDPTISSAQYFYSDAPQTLDAVKKLDANSWKNTLPSVISVNPASRYLWVKLTPVKGHELKDDIVDITVSSQISKVKGNLSTLPAYINFKLNVQVNFNQAGSYTLSQASDIPQEASVVYDLPGKNGASNNDLEALLLTKPDKATLELIKARLKVNDENKYVLRNDKEALLIINEVTRVVALSEAEKAELNKIELESEDDASTHNALVWKALPTLPPSISSIAYLSGNYASEDAAMKAPSNEWKSTLPLAVEYQFNRRYLWARLTPASGLDFQTHYVDISRSSGIKYVPNLLEAIDPVAYAKIDLSKVIVSGTWTNPIITIPESAGFTLPPYLRILPGFGKFYSALLQQMVDGFGAVSLENYTESLNVGKVVVTDESSKGFFLYLDLNNSQESDAVGPYTVKDDKRQTPQIKITKIESKKLMGYFRANGTSTNVAWSQVPLPYGFKSIEFFSGNFKTKEAVMTSGVAATNLPKVVDALKASRYLWVKATLNEGFELEDNENYIDITASSGIQSIA